MKKYIVETYYTCTFKTVHTLNDLDDAALSKIDQRTDGEVEVIDVKLNNRKTKKIGSIKEERVKNNKLGKNLSDSISNEIKKSSNDQKRTSYKPSKYKTIYIVSTLLHQHCLGE